MSNLYRLFQERFPQDLTQSFIETRDGEQYSYQDLIKITSTIESTMVDTGIIKGDRVIFQVNKSPEAIFLYLACLKLGAISVPLNNAYTASELSYFLDDIKPSLVVCDPASPIIKESLLHARYKTSLLTLDKRGDGSLFERIENNSRSEEIADVDENDIACILYTSGTTGKPKGAMITHGNLSSNALTVHQSWGFNSNDILLHALPVFHVHGLFVALNCVLLSGSSMIFLPEFNVGEIINLLPRATVLMGVPTFYTRLLSHPELSNSALKNMRLFISGSAPLLKEVSDDFYTKTGHRILERYGMTETVMIASNPLHDERLPGTVGQALSNITVRITADDDKILGDGETGNIQVSGPNVFKGYWRNSEKTQEAFTKDGFLKTGDVGFLDNKGYLTIVGRSKDLIISGGYNVYPKEIEIIMNSLDGVYESAVIGVPHPDFGEGVIAIVVLENNIKINESNLISLLKQELAAYKVPKIIFKINELPLNVMGKVQKNTLREKYNNVFDT
ncbi:MAG: malonyl-CoA/methylmalonyl-CoA synthetase [Gammaproteobacteria bacterium]|jgi:malonyl-CoA/methylmalonyl-CoA synthetase